MFYEYSQNNSGGSFVVNDEVCHRLFIEAESADEANRKAEQLGCYWDGVEKGRDCPCCGDRWYSAWDDDAIDLARMSDLYEKYEGVKFANIEEYAQYLSDKYGWTTPDARIYYADGTVKEIFSKEDQEIEDYYV